MFGSSLLNASYASEVILSRNDNSLGIVLGAVFGVCAQIFCVLASHRHLFILSVTSTRGFQLVALGLLTCVSAITGRSATVWPYEIVNVTIYVVMFSALESIPGLRPWRYVRVCLTLVLMATQIYAYFVGPEKFDANPTFFTVAGRRFTALEMRDIRCVCMISLSASIGFDTWAGTNSLALLKARYVLKSMDRAPKGSSIVVEQPSTTA